MLKGWLNRINITLALLTALIFAGALGITLLRESEIPHFEGPIEERIIPKNDLSIDPAAYNTIGSGPLELKYTPPTIQLPDLRKSLVYYGKNNRPDAQMQTPFLHFSFTGNKTPASIAPEQRNYIKYERNQTPPQYIFSPNNQETAIWIEATPQGNQALVKVGMMDGKGEMITEPLAHAQFTLPEKEHTRSTAAAPWEINKLRVDGTLLARQKARWYGVDKFLEKHGGPEFSHLAGKQRVDFGEGENAYSIYVGPADVVIWNGSQWSVTEPGPDTVKYPLMSIKKLDDRLMTFELWDVEGKNKVTLNLLKSTETWVPQNIQQAFKFVGARTRTQFVFEVNKERIMLSPQDWLLLTDHGWQKLTTPEEIDDYVFRKTTGPLFVFDEIEKRDDKQILLGTLFNATRTEAQQIEILMQNNSKKDESPPRPPSKPIPEIKKEDRQSGLPSQELMRNQSAEERR